MSSVRSKVVAAEGHDAKGGRQASHSRYPVALQAGTIDQVASLEHLSGRGFGGQAVSGSSQAGQLSAESQVAVPLLEVASVGQGNAFVVDDSGLWDP